MTEEIVKGIHRIPVILPNSPLKLLNSYVILGERNLLIDTGFRLQECYDSIQAGIRELGIDMSRTDILLTHLHGDHSGLVPTLATPTSRVFLGRKEIPWLIGESSAKLLEESNHSFVREGFSEQQVDENLRYSPSRSFAPEKTFENYTGVDDGDVFHYGDYELKAISTAGHTPDHMCFWIEHEKVMFLGDHVLFGISPNIAYWPGVEDSLGDYLENLKKIDNYDIAFALAGHRETGEVHSRVANLLAHHKERIEQCRQVVIDNPGLSAYDIAGKMTWRIRCNGWDDFPINQKWFAVGECHSHLRYLEKRGGVVGDYENTTIRFYPT